MNTSPVSKLDARLVGPFKVADSDTEGLDVSANYHLESLSGVKIDRTVPRDQLVVLVQAVWMSKRQQALYSSRELVAVGERFSNDEPGPVDVVDGAERFYYIVKERLVKGCKEVLVKCLGYNVPTWILETDVPIEIRRKLWEVGKKAQLNQLQFQ